MLLRRDGGCARPGCPETRPERLHAHHLRHWLFGGRTDLDDLVLLCDVDHGLVHDLDLVMARVAGRLVVTAPDGRHVWGTADAAFATGLADLDDPPTTLDDVGTSSSGTDAPPQDVSCPTAADPFTGVHPIDVEVGRRLVGVPGSREAGSRGRVRRDRVTTGGRRRHPGTRPGRGLTAVFRQVGRWGSRRG